MIINTLKVWAPRAAALLIAGQLAACATEARVSEMTVRPTTPVAAANEAGYHQIRLDKVEGGSNTNPMLMSQVSGGHFRTALETSLQQSQLLVPDGAAPVYTLSAYLLGLDQPGLGLDMTVTSHVHYVVAPVAGGAPVFDGDVVTPGTATLGSSLYGVERLKKANEISIRNNIESFLEKLRAALKTAH